MITRFHDFQNRSQTHKQSQMNQAKLVKRIKRWIANRESRKELARLPAHILKDLGISQSQAQRVAGKPFWQD